MANLIPSRGEETAKLQDDKANKKSKSAQRAKVTGKRSKTAGWT